VTNLLKTNAPVAAAHRLLETAQRLHRDKKENHYLREKVDTLTSDVAELKRQQQVALNLLFDLLNRTSLV
jgi:hypothetical protein